GFVENINLDDADLSTRIGLLSAQAGDPTVEVAEFVAERKHFADGAAKVGVALPKFGAVDVGLFPDRKVGVERLNREAEEVFEPLLQFDCLGKEQARVEGEDGKGE